MICLEFSATRWNLPRVWTRPCPAGAVVPAAGSPDKLFYGTKLERRQKQCYMWITGDRRARGSGKRIGSVQGGPGKSQGSLKTIPALEPMAERRCLGTSRVR